MNKSHSSKKVIIIGAGIAGLAANQALQQAGFDTIILEGRDRIGGRIATSHQLGVPLNCGAGWIHGIANNPITALAEKTHTNITIPSEEQYTRYDNNGDRIDPILIDQFEEKFAEILNKAKAYAFQINHDIPLSEAIAKVTNIADFTSVEYSLFQFKRQFFAGYIGADAEYLSARYWDLEQPWPGENVYLSGTYQPIINDLAKNANIQLNTIVKEIKLHTNEVEVITEKTSYHADFVILTVPLGVLKMKAISFNPPLPEAKQTAIDHLGMGLLNVSFIQFPEVCWPQDKQSFILTPIDDLSIPIYFNLHYFLNQPILMGYHGGTKSKRIEELTDAQLKELIMRDLKNVFGSHFPEPIALLTTHWSQDPFSYGSYSYVPVGASANDYEMLAQPIANRLFFAGEATNATSLATTHGAFISGIREANRIKNL